MAHFQIIKEVRHEVGHDWTLCFQYGTYQLDIEDRSRDLDGFRFIYRKPRKNGEKQGVLQGARGQARLQPSWIAILFGKAAAEGWYPVPITP